MNRKAAPRGTQAVQRAIQLLKSFATPVEELSLSQLADRHGLARPTAHRILAALEAEGLIGRNQENAAYRLSPHAAAFASDPTSLVEAGADSGSSLSRAGLPKGPIRSGSSARSTRSIRSMPKTTPFFERILEHHDSFGWRNWSGYIAPTSYEPSFTREYWAIRNAVAMIDVTPLFKYQVSGPDAQRLVQRVMTRDFAKCRVGQVMYGCWCDDEGQLVQDGNVIRVKQDVYQVSAADPCLAWLQDAGAGMRAEVTDVSDDIGALSIQGPRSRQVLNQVLEKVDLRALRYFRSASARFEGQPVMVTRTGFTGDLGFELWIDRQHAIGLWDRLLDQGQSYGLLPVGLVAMDAARIEAGLVLIEVDYVSSLHAFLEGRKSSPYEAGLGWTVKLNSDNEFIGRPALEREHAAGSRWATVGLEISWSELERVHAESGLRPQSPGHEPCRDPTPLWIGEEHAPGARRTSSRASVADHQVGQITSQTFSPLLKKQIAIASVESEYSAPGTELQVEILVDRTRTRALGRVASLPFYDPPHKRSHGRKIQL